MAAPHRFPFKRDERQCLGKAFQRRVASRPADAVQEYVGEPGGRHEFALAQTIEENAMIIGARADRSKSALQPFADDRRDLRRAEMAQEDKLAITDLARDPHEYIVVLRQILEERLAAPKNSRAWTQAQLLACDLDRLRVDGLVVDRQVRQPHKFFGVDTLLRPAAPSGRSTGSSPLSAGHWFPDGPRNCIARGQAAAPPAVSTRCP